MEALDRSILATLAYYGALRRPLTPVETYERLIPSERLGVPALRPTLGAIVSRLDALVADTTVVTEYGLYALADTPAEFGALFVQRQKESARKYQRLLKYAWWLQAVPYVRALATSGSLALASTGKESDWDMFVVAHAGRLYTARTSLLLATLMMGRLRTKRMRSAPDTFCFNHYITTDGLALRHRSIFTAHAMAWLIPVFDTNNILRKLWQANQWICDYSAQAGGTEFVRRSVTHSRVLNAARRTLEFFLNTFIGAAIERVFRVWMQRRINRNPVTRERGGRIVADARELEFHPHSFEAVALARYHTTLTRYGLGRYLERDSGLTK
ncbi:MAG: hypothetical protein AAB375_00560 [Patescibacteria group bacterium]